MQTGTSFPNVPTSTLEFTAAFPGRVIN